MLEALRLASDGIRDTSDMLTVTVLNNSQSVYRCTVIFCPGY